jgi:hypothetical protein
MAFHLVFDRRNDSRPYPNLAPMMHNPHDSYAGMGDSWPRIAPCRLLLYCADHGYPYQVSYTNQPLPDRALYPIGLAWFDYSIDYFGMIPADTREYIKQGRLTVLFYYHEGDNPYRERDRLNALCVQHNLPTTCYRFISGNTQADCMPGFVYFPDHELFYWRNGVEWNGQPQPYCAVHEAPRSKRFTLLSRIHKWWRATVVTHLRGRGLLTDSYWSYNTVDIGDLPENNPIQIGLFPGLDLELKEFLTGAPYRCDDLTAEEHNSHWILADHLYQDSYASIVLETLYDAEQSGGAFITEKTFKAILNGHPFVIFGCAGTLATLRGLGYRTFDSHIDNSYDSEPDNTQRFIKTVRAVDQLQQQGDLHRWYQACQADILHNQRLFISSKYDRLAALDRYLSCAE